MCTKSLFVALTLEAFCKPVFSFIQLNNDSIGCLTLEKPLKTGHQRLFKLPLGLTLSFYQLD